MPKRINQRQAVAAIAAHKDFKATALSGFNQGDAYHVKSYDTIIATFKEGEGWALNARRYSVTTSRHQATVRRAIDLHAKLRKFDHQPSRIQHYRDRSTAAALEALAKTGAAGFATVADIPDAYALLTGDEAHATIGAPGCAFVLDHDGERLSVYACDSAVPYLDAPVRDVYRAARLAA